jgi:hypothetical protein
MTERDPNIVHSSLSRRVTRDGITVEVVIVRLEDESKWSLEVVNAKNTSIVWDELFPTDECLRRVRADRCRGGDADVSRQRKGNPLPPVRFGPSRNEWLRGSVIGNAAELALLIVRLW